MDGLIKQLQNPALYDHPVDQFEVIETHLSWVLLTGPYVYKIKKPVNFGFVDFSTLEKRHYFCQEEIKLNQPLAGMLYEGLLPLYGSMEMPQFKPAGNIIEYVIKMKQFRQTDLFSALQQQHALTPDFFSSIAKQIAIFHQNTNVATVNSHFGNYESVATPVLDNYRHCRELKNDPNTHKRLHALELWANAQLQALRPIIEHRKTHGFVKNCHGDLHLGNIALIHNAPVIFDCIEFNDAFHWIDVMNEVAFLSMDLLSKGECKLSTHFINEYLFHTGDYAGLRLFTFYLVYRAMIRAKVALLTDIHDTAGQFEQYLNLAESFTQSNPSHLILMHGVSGAGKSYLSRKLTGSLQAFWLRSDIERKRLMPNTAMTALYQEDITEKTYQHLLLCTESILEAKLNVIVDATFLKAKHRQWFIDLSKKLKCSIHIIQCIADEPILKQRISKRHAEAQDPSDATIDVLKTQLQQIEPLSEEEQRIAIEYRIDNHTAIQSLEEKLVAF